MARLNQTADSSFAFSDSVAIDADGAKMYDNYKGYYASLGDHSLDQDNQFTAREFLRENADVAREMDLDRAEHYEREAGR